MLSVTGTRDTLKQFRLAFVMIISNEDEEAYTAGIKLAAKWLMDKKGFVWAPDLAVHDNAGATYNAVLSHWGDLVLHLNCYFHLQQNFFGHKANVKFNNPQNAPQFRADVRSIACEFQFLSAVDDAIDLLLEKWKDKELVVCNNFREYYGTNRNRWWQRIAAGAFGTNTNNSLERNNRHIKEHLLQRQDGNKLSWGVLLLNLLGTVKGQSLEQRNTVWPSDAADYDCLSKPARETAGLVFF